MISEKNKKYDQLYLDIAKRISKMSYAQRLHVGCVLIKNDGIISFGWNGMPSGWDNSCEDFDENSQLITRPEVLHAESNCLSKIAKSHESSQGASLYLTHSPCIHCAKLIYQAGIIRVIYMSDYRSSDGLQFLKKCGVEVVQVVDNLIED